MRNAWWVYAAAFGAALTLALGLTPLALRIAMRFGILDEPNPRKTQTSPVPYLGGLAIVAAFSAVLLAASALASAPLSESGLLVVTMLAFGLSLIGLIDDLRGLHPLPRFALQIAAAIIVWASGIGVNLTQVPGVDAAITIFWIVGVTNAFNLLDNMDGLSAGIAAIASGFLFLLALINGQFAVAALSAAIAGCALGFLRHNVHPAQIYMGDAGSLFLGFMLAVIAIKLRFDAPSQITFMVPILVLGVAILDTTLVVVTRFLNGLNPFIGGRDHISHRLVFIGISVRAAVALVYAAGIALGWLAVVMSRIDPVTGYILMGFVIAVSAFAGAMLALVPIHEESGRRRLMLMEVAPHEEHAEPIKIAQSGMTSA